MKLYDDLADWWPLISSPADYVEEAEDAIQQLQAAATSPIRELLELGSGGGNMASFLKQVFTMTLVEPSAGMRAVSEALNPECTHLAGDMRTVRLDRTFDAVFVHDAIMHMATEADLRAALETIAAHLKPGGVALIVPDATTETFESGTELWEGDEMPTEAGDGRSVRYMMWTLPPAPGSSTHHVHLSFLLRDHDGQVRAVHDVHEEGLFPRATWLRLLDEAGLAGQLGRRTIDESDYDVFIARKPAHA